MNKSIFIILLTTQASVGFSQNNQEDRKQAPLYLGAGFGLDYGGLGLKFEYQPIKYAGAYVGLGYNLQGYAINLGASFYPLPNKKLQPILSLLYGYNAAIIVADMPEWNKTYYGISPGIGALVKTGKKDNKLYLGIFRPFRSQSFYDDRETLETVHSVNFDTKLLPVTFSIGFNWAL